MSEERHDISREDCILFWNLLQGAWASGFFQDPDARKRAVETEQRLQSIVDPKPVETDGTA